MIPISILKRFGIFEGLTDSQLESIAALCQEEVYESGVEIFREGEEAKYLYLLLVGTVALEMDFKLWPEQPPRKTLIEIITRGQPFGWSAVAKPHIFTLSAKALERSRVIAVDGEDLRVLFEDDPTMGYLVTERLTHIVSRRLRETRQKSIQFVREGEIAREYAPEESTLVEGLHNFIKFRWVAAAGVLLLALLARGIFRIEFPLLQVLAGVGAILVYNLLFWFSARRLTGKTGAELVSTARRFAYAQPISDLWAITILVHYTGGIENPFLFYYVFHVFIASILLSRELAYALATLALILFSSLVGLEYFGIIPHVHLGGFTSPLLYLQPAFVLGVLVAFATTLYMGCYLTTYIAEELKRRQWEIVALKNRLAAEAKELDETNRELVRLDRLKTYFLAMASHDLKTPLAAVESYLQVILGGFVGEVPEKQKQMLERSSIRIRELVAMINRFLDFARIERGAIVEKMDLTSLEEVIDTCVEEARLLASDKGLEFRVERPEHLPQIYASPSHVQQVLTNLLGNAVKFTEEGMVALKVEEVGEQIQVSVTDTGVGIDSEDMPRIFEDFYRGKSVGGGTGLGLSIAKRIVEAHRGKIWAQSPYAEGQPGSRFTFVIPKDSKR